MKSLTHKFCATELLVLGCDMSWCPGWIWVPCTFFDECDTHKLSVSWAGELVFINLSLCFAALLCSLFQLLCQEPSELCEAEAATEGRLWAALPCTHTPTVSHLHGLGRAELPHRWLRADLMAPDAPWPLPPLLDSHYSLPTAPL